MADSPRLRVLVVDDGPSMVSLELSASACLTKPLEIGHLLGTIQREVERRRPAR